MPLFLIKNVAALLVSTTIMGGSASTPATGTQFASIVNTPIASSQAPIDAWIDSLIQLESRGNDRIKILDVNGRYSYGCLQFQMDTFWRYGTKYNILTNADEDNLGTLIYNCDIQKTIAKAMIDENRSNWRHWYTSVTKKKLGPPPLEAVQIADATK